MSRRQRRSGKRKQQRNESHRQSSTTTTTTTTEHPWRKVIEERDFQAAVASLLQSIQLHQSTLRPAQLLPPPLFPDPNEMPPADAELNSQSQVEQLRMADDYWIKESTIQVNGQYSTFCELLMQDNEPHGEQLKKKGAWVRLPWNRQDNNPRGETARLVYNIRAFRSSEFGKSELFMLISKMMFLNGDCTRTSMLSTFVVARMIQEELISMLIQIIQRRGKTQEQMEKESCTPPITYGEIVGWLKHNCPIRLRRIVKYQMAENSHTHPVYLVRPLERPRQKQDLLMNQLQDNTPVDVRIFRDMCPLLYNAMLEHIPYPTAPGAQPRNPVDNLRWYTTKYDSELEHDIDLHLHLSRQFLKTNETIIRNDKTMEKLKEMEKVSMCSVTGRKNAYFAVLFHEMLGKPPLESDVIYILDFLARELIREVVIMALTIRREFVESTEDEPIEVPVYIEAISALREEMEHANILCGKGFQYPRPEGPMKELPELPDKEVLTNLDKLIARAKRWDKKSEMEKALENVNKKGKAKETIHLSAELIANIFSSEMLLRAHAAAMPPKPAPQEKKDAEKQTKRRRRRRM